MLIDWFTVLAQGVNFLILVWLLKRFLYKPVLDAVDAREKLIAAQLEQAASERAEAERERAAYEAKNRSFQSERDGLMTAAQATADQERTALLQKARSEYESLRTGLLQQLAEERQELTHSIVSRVLAEVFSIARRLLGDLSDRNLEERIVEIFVRRLHSLSEAERSNLRARLAGRDQSTAVKVRSAFELSTEQRAVIDKEMASLLPGHTGVTYEQAPELLGGIELVANGYRLRWSIEDYLGSLRERIDAALQAPSQT